MTYIEQPLYPQALRVRGALGQIYIFRQYGAHRQVYPYYYPYNPRTPQQQSWRGVFADAVANWQGFSDDVKGYYNDLKYPNVMSGFNRYIRFYLRANMGVINPLIYYMLCQGRLTLTSNLAVTTADVLAATTLYFTPFQGNNISIYDGSTWQIYTFTQRSIAIPSTTNTNYDIFIYNNAGTITLEAVAWTDDDTRATDLAIQDGIYVKSGALDHRYLGTIRTTGTSGQCEDSVLKRFVWNYYNRVSKRMTVIEATNSWNYTTDTWRQANANTANKFAFVVGVIEDDVDASVEATVYNATADVLTRVGIGHNSTSAIVSGMSSSG